MSRDTLDLETTRMLRARLKDASTNPLIKLYIYGYDLASNRTSERVANKITASTPNTTKGPVPSINGSSADIPVTVSFYPSGKPK